MEIDETSLRELMLSAHGSACGQAIIDRIQGGEAVEITMDDSTTLRLTEVIKAAHFLSKSFGWKP